MEKKLTQIDLLPTHKQQQYESATSTCILHPFTSLINFMLHWCEVWYIPHLTCSKFLLYHVVRGLLLFTFLLKILFLSHVVGYYPFSNTIYDSILYFMTNKKLLNEGKEQSLIPLLLLWVTRKSLSNVLFLYSIVLKLFQISILKLLILLLSAFHTCVQEPRFFHVLFLVLSL